METKISISGLILEYFQNHPKQPLQHGEVVDWVEAEYFKAYGKKPRDTWRGIRQLHQQGKLVKVDKGLYMYDPDYIANPTLEEFTPSQKQAILERDGYRCVVCGLGESDGLDLQIDHIRPKDKGGEATIENGQTLCTKHNLLKKNYGQTETGKRLFINFYKTALAQDDEEMLQFFEEVLQLYDKYSIDTHIEWKPNTR